MSAMNMNVNLERGSRRSTSIQSALLSCFDHLAGVAAMATTGGAYLLRLLVDWGSARRENKDDSGCPPETGDEDAYGSGSRRGSANGNGSETGNGGKEPEPEPEPGCGCEIETANEDRNDRHHHRKSNGVHDTETDVVQSIQSPDEEDKQTRRRRAAGEGGDWYREGNLKVLTGVPHLVSVVCGFAKDLETYPEYSPGKFGEDAWFKTVTPRADILGVADGVGSWRNCGVDPGVFSTFLMSACESLANLMDAVPQRPDLLLARAYFHLLEQPTPVVGSCTACIVALDRATGILHAVNLGDSGFMVVRGGTVVCRSEEQQHEFNTPFQLTCLPPEMEDRDIITDEPEMADILEFQTEPGDVLLLATDGVFDNLPEQMLLEVMSEMAGVSDAVRLQKAANTMALMARTLGFDPDHDSPFSQNARMNDIDVLGGKPDDITVILATVC